MYTIIIDVNYRSTNDVTSKNLNIKNYIYRLKINKIQNYDYMYFLLINTLTNFFKKYLRCF